MIKKLSLYGLCFNLGVAWATPPTQEELDAFIAAQGGNIKVRRTLFGNPDRIKLKNEAAYKAWENFSRWHRDSSGAWNYPNAPESTDSSLVENLRSIFKERTPEERRECFSKYSREATTEERALIAEWTVGDLRFIDFDSIVNGLECEEQRKARRLMADDSALKEAIATWVDGCCSQNVYDAEIFVSKNPCTKDSSKMCIGAFQYRLTPETVTTAKNQLKEALRDMSHYESTRGILVLSLVLVKPLGISAISLPNMEHINAKLLSLTYDLQENLYNLLGICGRYSILGNLDSSLERDLFRFLERLPAGAEPVKIPSGLFQRLFCENYSDSNLDLIEISQQKFFRAAQMALLWFNLEEIWYEIGFASVDDVIYVNRMSRMNLLKTPVIFLGGVQNFTDLKRLFGLDIDLSTHPLLKRFLTDMNLTVAENLPSLCPTREAWNVWLQLQGRTDVDAGYLPMLNKTKEELTKDLLSIELIGGK